MKKCLIFAAAALLGLAANGPAKAQEADSLKTEQLEAAVVAASGTPRSAPFAVSKISKTELEQFAATVKELPYLFSQTPGVIASSDNGLGSGTTYLRIRGSGDSRINVTLDGVPLNSPEDQCVFWANLNSYASFLGGVTLQRGVGASSNGDGAFGGTVALRSKMPSTAFEARIDVSYGSYNSGRVGASVSSGLLGGKWAIDGTFHHSFTDGYIHGTPGQGGSWMAGVTFFATPWLLLRYRNIGNYERTGQAWNGVETHGEFASYAEMYAAGLGRYNSLCEERYKDEKGHWYFRPYPQITTDNFLQDHNLLTADFRLGSRWKLSTTLHYTWGSGYYSNFQHNAKLSKFGLQPVPLEDGNTLTKCDFVRKKGLTQHHGGLVVSANRRSDKLDLFLGLNVAYFSGVHYGDLTYIGNEVLRALISQDGAPYRYYFSDAQKNDESVYAKASWKLGAGFSLYGDLQFRLVHYRLGAPYNVTRIYPFFNPKAGVEWRRGAHSAFASFAMANREPERNNFTDNGSYGPPRPERLFDYELGYSFDGKIFRGGLTLYYMDYKDQFVQTGAVSDIGEALTTNIARSYRTGAELSLSVSATSWLDIEADGAFSLNRLREFREVVDNWDGDPIEVLYTDAPLAYSPGIVAGGGFRAHWNDIYARWRTSYVSRQYLDNTGCAERSIPGYTTSDLEAGYTFRPGVKALKGIKFGLLLGNLFDSHHATGGWVYSAVSESAGYTLDHRYMEAGYTATAGFSLLGTVSILF